MKITVNKLIDSIKKLGFEVFEDDSKPFNLNIVGVRSNDNTPNTFNDELHVFWNFRGNWSHLIFTITTDPGLYWLLNPMNPNGTIIMYAPQQVRGAYKNGLHKGKLALEQVKPMKYWRDDNKDTQLDSLGKIYEEDASTNLHGAGANSFVVGKYSAGCQVVANDNEYDLLLHITKEAEKIWGNSFTYTLITEDNIL